MKKLNAKGYFLYKAVNFVSVILLAIMILFLWQLYRGSIQLPFLKPYIVKALNHDDADYQVDLDSVSLELVRSIRPFRIIAKNVSYKKENAINIIAEKVSLSFSVTALMHGVIAPSSIEIDQPSIYIYNNYNIKDNKDTDEIEHKKLLYYIEKVKDFWDHFNSQDNTYPESYINSIKINKAELELLEVDLGKKWQFSDVNFNFGRKFGSLNVEINALMPFNASSSSLGINAEYKYNSNSAEIDFYFSDLIPADLINLLSTNNKSKDSYYIKVPLHGKISTNVNLNSIESYKEDLGSNLDKIIDKINFDFVGEKGVIKFSNDEKYNYPISGVLLKGEISGNLETINIDNASLKLDNQEAKLGLKIDGLKDYWQNSATNNIKFSIHAMVDSIETSKLTDYWPKYFSDTAWNWCRESLYDGYIRNGDFTFDFSYNPQTSSIEFEKLSGTADIDKSTIFYLKGMPVITDTKGKATFTNSSIYIDIEQGKSDGVMLNGGYVELYDLNKENNFIKIDLQAVGSITDVLKLVDNEPLKYSSSAGLDPDSIKGSSEIDLKLGFELRKDLSPKDVNCEVNAVLHDVEVKNIIQDRSVDAKNLLLSLNNQGLKINGVVNIEGLPISVNWEENFDENNSYQRTYQLGFNFDRNFMNKTGLNISALQPPFIKGSIPTKAIITVDKNNSMNVDVHGNLRETIINYGFLGFAKTSGENGEISAQLKIKDKKLKEISSFSLSKPEFKVNGDAEVDSSSRVNKINISSIKGPRTNASAQINISYKPKPEVKIIVSGSSYDLSAFFDKLNKDDSESDNYSKDNTSDQKQDDNWDNIPNSEIDIAVDRLWTSPNIYTSSFAGSARVINKVGIDEIHVVGNFKNNSSKSYSKERPYLKLDYVPRGNKEYLLQIDSNDAGSALKFLRLYDNLKGGTLTIEAKRGADKIIIGHAKARNFNLTKTGILVKLLTVASFSGILDMLSGDGIAFTHFDAPFAYDGTKLTLNKAKASGNVLGLSGSGDYNKDTKNVDFKGLIAPMYNINTMIGKIPLVGKLLSGKDGTIFAVNYSISGSISDPTININPLSALSPNSIKELWSDEVVE